MNPQPNPRSRRGRFVVPLILACLVTHSSLRASDAGRDWGIERSEYLDPVTGIRVTELTRGTNAADNLYFHFSNFTADNRQVLFVQNRTGSAQLFQAEVGSGRIIQLTDSPGINPRSACPDPQDAQRVFLMRGAEVVALDTKTFSLRRIGEIPGPHVGGFQQPTVSHDGRALAVTKQRDAGNWEIGLLSIETGTYRTVVTQGFRIGHVQHSPTDPTIFYVWETGGYAPQRTWLVNSDGTGNRPFYARTASTNWFTPLKEWVTHEAWIQNTGEMTMINDKLGVMIVHKDGSSRLVREGNYWHAAARPDGKYLVIDDMQGRLWLCASETGDIRLLATGLRDSVRVHAHASFDRRGDFVQFHSGRTQETVALIDLRTLPTSVWR